MCRVYAFFCEAVWHGVDFDDGSMGADETEADSFKMTSQVIRRMVALALHRIVAKVFYGVG